MFRRLGAAGGIAYGVLAAIENIDVLGAPGYDSSVREIVAQWSGSETRLGILAVAGTLALAGYVLFVVGAWSAVRAGDTDGSAWSVLGLVGGVGGVVIAVIAQTAQLTLVLRARDGLTPSVVRALYDIDLGAHTLAGFFIAFFLVGIATAGRRAGVLPVWLVLPAWTIAAFALVLSPTGFSTDSTLHTFSVLSFGFEVVWVFLVAAWILWSDWRRVHDEPLMIGVGRLALAVVGVAAGVSGIGLLAFPASTPEFFSWGLGPPQLAALIGGFYVASSLVYVWGAVAPWGQARVLLIGIVALTVPVFVSTMIDLEVFDFGRLTAWGWVILFGLFPIVALIVLVTQPGDASDRGGDVLTPAVRVVLGAGAAVLLVVSVALWADPVGMGDVLPFTPASLSGRVLGGWTFTLSVLAGYAGLRGAAREVRLALVALAAFPAGALIATVRTFDDLAPSGRRAAYVAVLAVWLAAAAVLLVATSHNRKVVQPA